MEEIKNQISLLKNKINGEKDKDRLRSLNYRLKEMELVLISTLKKNDTLQKISRAFKINITQKTYKERWTPYFQFNWMGNIYFINFSNTNLGYIPSLIGEFFDLSELSLKYQDIEKIDRLNDLNNLKSLNLQGNKIKKIEGLEDLRNLKYLDLYNNQIEKIEGLENLRSLNTLILGKNKIKKIENLDGLKNLEFLALNGNAINKIEGLDALIKLKQLIISNNYIKKIEGLNNLKSLINLNLKENFILKVENIENLPYLSTVNLEDNPITFDSFCESNRINIKSFTGKFVISKDNLSEDDKFFFNTWSQTFFLK